MTWFAILASRLRGVVMGRRDDQQFDLEMAGHLELLTEDYIRRGLPPAEARREDGPPGHRGPRRSSRIITAEMRSQFCAWAASCFRPALVIA